jgi:xanthine/CO dehydrogenase XdhC/CoxF family maturation factor
MKQVWDDILTASENSSKTCLATVIATEGTAPRKEGSKMLIIGGESLKGAVTIGGCIDAQVIEAAEEVTRTGEPQLLRAELGEEDAFEIGLTCAGALRVLVEPVKLEPEIFLQLRQALTDGTPFALLTVTRSSLPSIKPASKIMLSSSGRVYGSLGDDRLNSVAANIAAGLLSKGISRTVALDGSFQPPGEGQQEEVEIFVEVVGQNPDLFHLRRESSGGAGGVSREPGGISRSHCRYETAVRQSGALSRRQRNSCRLSRRNRPRAHFQPIQFRFAARPRGQTRLAGSQCFAAYRC